MFEYTLIDYFLIGIPDIYVNIIGILLLNRLKFNTIKTSDKIKILMISAILNLLTLYIRGIQDASMLLFISMAWGFVVYIISLHKYISNFIHLFMSIIFVMVVDVLIQIIVISAFFILQKDINVILVNNFYHFLLVLGLKSCTLSFFIYMFKKKLSIGKLKIVQKINKDIKELKEENYDE